MRIQQFVLVATTNDTCAEDGPQKYRPDKIPFTAERSTMYLLFKRILGHIRRALVIVRKQADWEAKNKAVGI